MLVLSRGIGETIRLGDAGEVTVIVLGVRGSQVRLGIGAPKGVPVHRQEIFDRIHSTHEGDRTTAANGHE